MAFSYDIIIFGGGVAGLWLCATLKRAGYNVILIEKDRLGAGQTLASQGMIHGGQKYALQGRVTGHAQNISEMPARWDAALGGFGEVDLTDVKILSENQVMWPAGGIVSEAAVFGAAKLVNAETKKLKTADYPEIFLEKKKFKGPVYQLPEKVIDTRALVQALAKPLKGRIFRGAITEMLPDGQVAVSGQALRAEAIIFTGGAGNETALSLLKVAETKTQRRPLRQVMVRSLPYALYGHGVVGAPKPRLTVTSHQDGMGGYVWYIGGALAEKGAALDEAETLAFARAELEDVFPEINWGEKEWAALAIDRAEPHDPAGDLPQGPHLHQRGRILLCWPAKLTFAPALSDRVFDWLKQKEITPQHKDAPPDFPTADIASYPWEVAQWRRLP